MFIKDNLDNLNEKDLYSLILFALYKLIGTPEYSSISELIYVLDKDNLLNLCEFFGGSTIRIPTIQELETVVKALSLYEQVNIRGVEYDTAVCSISDNQCEIKDIRKAYLSICDTLENYSFRDGGAG
jgi:hypothetical protein